MTNQAAVVRRIAAALFVAFPLAAQTPVTLDHEAKHHPVFSNAFVRVLDVVVPAGDSTLYHVHPNDYVYVTFGDVSLKAQALGAQQTDLTLKNGEVRMTKAPISHRVLNPGQTPFHNLTIELLKGSGTALAPTPAGVVVMDSARVRVERIILEPGQSAPKHEHRGPGLDVAVSGGTIDAIDATGAHSQTTLKPAWYKWFGAPRTHTLTNTGRTRVEIVEIEWK